MTDDVDPREIAQELRTLARGIEAGECEVTIAERRPVLTPGADGVSLEVEWQAEPTVDLAEVSGNGQPEGSHGD